MEDYRFDIIRQFRRILVGTGLVAIVNSVIAVVGRLSYLPQYGLGLALFFFLVSRFATLKTFAVCYFLSFIGVLGHAFLTIYEVGEDCGIQLYLLALLLPANYIRLTEYSRRFQNCFIVGACCASIAGYMISDELIDHMIVPLRRIDEKTETIFTFINAAGSLSLLSYVSGLFAKSYQEEFVRLFRRNQELNQKAFQDELTKLLNRRGGIMVLKQRYQAWAKLGETLTVAVADIDHFKEINDGFGHEAGDQVLTQLGSIMKEFLPDGAVACRWGGEEFLLLLPGSLETSGGILESLREQVGKQRFLWQNKEWKVTITIGAAFAGETESSKELLQLADSRLYYGKKHGRNQVILKGFI